jgi:hypothetical protein
VSRPLAGRLPAGDVILSNFSATGAISCTAPTPHPAFDIDDPLPKYSARRGG